MKDKISPIALNIDDIAKIEGSGYPSPHDVICNRRIKSPLSQAFDLTQFGVNITTIPAGQATAQRHWHMTEDEFLYVLSGHPTLITNTGKTRLSPNMFAGFKAGDKNGHHLVNETDQPITILEVGTRSQEDECFYPDIDLHLKGPRYFGEKASFSHKDGTEY